MTLSEFKAWFEGFSEVMEGPPNEDQWKRIKARVAEINGAPTSYPVFIDRYVTPYRLYYDGPIWNGVAPYGGGTTMLSTASPVQQREFDAALSMSDLGRAEYKAAIAA